MSGFATEQRVTELAIEIGGAFRSVDDAVRLAAHDGAAAKQAAVAAATNAEAAKGTAENASISAQAAQVIAAIAQDVSIAASAAAAQAGDDAAAAAATAKFAMPFATRADALALPVPAPVNALRIGDLSYIADQNGTALTTADGRKWAPAESDQVSPEHFGAIADGISDDAAAISAAISYAAAKRKILRLRGKYRAAFAPPDAPLTIEGAPGAEMILPPGMTSGALIRHTSAHPLLVRGVTFIGRADAPTARAILVDQSTNVLIDGCTFRGWAYQPVEQLGAGRYCTVTGCLFEDCTSPNLISFRGEFGSVLGCTFRRTAAHAVRFGRMFSDGGTFPSSGYSGIVSGCTFEQIANDAVLCEINARSVVITGNVARDIRSLVKAQSTDTPFARQIIVSDNIVIGQIVAASDGVSKGPCVKLETGVTDCVVSGNVIQGFEVGVQAGARARVQSNIIRDTTGSASIDVLGDSCSVVNNNITNCAATTAAIRVKGAMALVSGNDAVSATRGIRIEGDRARVFQNLLSAPVGIYATGGLTRLVVRDNDVAGCATPLAIASSGPNIIVADNMVS